WIDAPDSGCCHRPSRARPPPATLSGYGRRTVFLVTWRSKLHDVIEFVKVRAVAEETDLDRGLPRVEDAVQSHHRHAGHRLDTQFDPLLEGRRVDVQCFLLAGDRMLRR